MRLLWSRFRLCIRACGWALSPWTRSLRIRRDRLAPVNGRSFAGLRALVRRAGISAFILAFARGLGNLGQPGWLQAIYRALRKRAHGDLRCGKQWRKRAGVGVDGGHYFVLMAVTGRVRNGQKQKEAGRLDGSTMFTYASNRAC